MAKLKIVTFPNDILTTPAEPVSGVDGKMAQFMDDMAETMYASQGVGLAAPQVGLSRQIMTLDVGSVEEGGFGLVHLANPEIVEGHGELLWDEGCLSFPGLTVQVQRYAEVHVRGLNRQGEVVDYEASGLGSVCFQHEIDHLKGITFVQRLKGLRRRFAIREYMKAVKGMKAGDVHPLT